MSERDNAIAAIIACAGEIATMPVTETTQRAQQLLQDASDAMRAIDHRWRVPKDCEGGAMVLLAMADHVSAGRGTVGFSGPPFEEKTGGNERTRVYVNVALRVEDEGELGAIFEDTRIDLRVLHDMSIDKRYQHAERMALKWAALYEDLTNAMRSPLGQRDAASAMRGHLDLRLRIRATAKRLIENLPRLDIAKRYSDTDPRSSEIAHVGSIAKALAESVLLYLVGDA